jgi:hypothetical protein
VVVTLPATPSVGDIVRVNGLGAGGWRIAQNDGQTIVGQKLWILGWAPRESNRLWRSVASSADGTKLVAVVLGGQIYTSTNSGVTWAARDQNRNWASVASSADGTQLVAVALGGQIYTSTNSGQTWGAKEASRDWISVASSADGTKLAAVVFGGQIYTSTNSGANWTANGPIVGWRSVASSADGTKLVAATVGGHIYTSNIMQDVQTAIGTSGGITGERYEAIELQYVGGGRFNVLSASGVFRVQ